MSSSALVVNGLDQIAEKFNRLEGDILEKALVVIDNALQPMELAMRTNAATMFNKGYSRQIMTRSVGRSSGIIKNSDGINFGVGGQVGVFDMKERTGDYGYGITAPVLARMYESGIRPHFTTTGTTLTRKDNSRQGKLSEQHEQSVASRKSSGRDELKMHPGSAPIPFLSQAWETGAPALFSSVEKELDKLIQAQL